MHDDSLIKRSLAAVFVVALVIIGISGNSPAWAKAPSQQPEFKLSTIAEGLEHPWGMAFLPDGSILITERPGRLRLIKNGVLQASAVSGLPEISATGQGGLLDVALHPEYRNNGWIYFSYSAGEDGNIGTEVGRGKLVDNQIKNWQTLFRLTPKSSAWQHFGSRLVFDLNNYLYITLGDRGERFRSQDTDDHAGSVIRLHDDGSIPDDNPFRHVAGSKPEIYSFGHRNIQGAALHPASGKLWIHEHGPQGGDELNIVEAGENYGWPIISYGKEYVSGDDIGEGTHKAGMQQPIYYWVPSIAPSGMTFYHGDKFPAWQGNLFIGSLKFELLVRLVLEGDKVTHEQRLLKNEIGRIRDVEAAADGYLYLLTDEDDGKLVRLEP